MFLSEIFLDVHMNTDHDIKSTSPAPPKKFKSAIKEEGFQKVTKLKKVPTEEVKEGAKGEKTKKVGKMPSETLRPKEEMISQATKEEMAIDEEEIGLEDLEVEDCADKEDSETVNNFEEGVNDHNKEEVIILNSCDKDELDRENNELKGKLSSMRKKLKNSVQREERLNSELKRHNLALTMMKSGINQLIKDKATPPSMIQSLKLLKHSANFSSSDGPTEKKIKLEEHVEIDDVKGEYFEDISVKQETPNEGTAEEKRQT